MSKDLPSDHIDEIQSGTAAPQTRDELAEWLIENRPGIADAYRAGGNYFDICERLHQIDRITANRKIVHAAVIKAMRTLISNGRERSEIAQNYKKRAKEHSRMRDKTGQLSKGVVPWKNINIDHETGLDEFDFCLKLLADSSYKVQRGKKEYPDYQKIADTLNAKFHKGKIVRKVDGVRYIQDNNQGNF